MTDKQEINKHLMAWIEGHSAPRLEGRELSSYELGQVVSQYASVAKQAVEREISNKRNDMRTANEGLMSHAEAVEHHKQTIAYLERELTAAMVRAHSAGDVGHLEGLFKQQIELIQSRLNWQYVAFFQNYFWFRTPMNTMVRRESGRTDTVETCSYLVGFRPMSQENGGWRVMPITGNLLDRNYGCPFHSGLEWCYGSGYNQAKDQLLSGDMFRSG